MRLLQLTTEKSTMRHITQYLIACTAILIIIPGRLHSQNERRDAAVIARAKLIPVSQIEPGLPSVPFAEWFQDVVGNNVLVSWEVDDCGEQSGTDADRGRDFPMCATAIGEGGGGKVVVQIQMGTFKKGVWGKPILRMVYAERNQDISKLSELRAKLAGLSLKPITENIIDNAPLNITTEGSDVTQLFFDKGKYRQGKIGANGPSEDFLVAEIKAKAIGDLNGDQVADAAVIVSANKGGTGEFFSLCALIATEDDPLITEPILLGDRVNVQSLQMKSGEIVIQIITHGPSDPLCCPTMKATLTYGVENEELIQKRSSPSPTTAPKTPRKPIK